MKSTIVHADGRVINLAAAIDADTYAELETTRYTRATPVLWCGTCGGSIYIRHGSARASELFGAHHRATDCAADLAIRKSGMSDEHKYQAEHHAQAAVRAGYAADLEVTTTGHTRVDVVIDGRIGIEVQRSALKKAAAVDRTARSVAAGLASVSWFTDRTSSPQWTGHVPGYRTTMPADIWKSLPAPRTVTAAGLRTIRIVRCGWEWVCPHQRGSACGRPVPVDEPWTGLVVDDVVEGLAAGQILPVRLHRNVQLLSAASIGLYEELTGERLTYDPGPPRVALPPSDRVDCTLPLRVPSDAPAPVREWLEAEQARVQAELARAELEQEAERLRREQAERERLARQDRAERQREERQRQHQEMVRAAAAERERREQAAYARAAEDRRQRELLERERAERQRQEQAELLRRQNELRSYDQRIRQAIAAKDEQRAWCDFPGCHARGSRYMNGTRCDQHKP